MRNISARVGAVVCLLSLVAWPARAGQLAPSADFSEADLRTWHELLIVEDARPTEREKLTPILAQLTHDNPRLRRIAVRAAGRLERPDLVRDITPLLAAREPDLRAEAANALAQALHGYLGGAATLQGVSYDAAIATVVSALAERLGIERDSAVRGHVAASLGRLPYRSADQVTRAEASLLEAATADPKRDLNGDPALQTLGALRGFESLFRLHGKLAAPTSATLQRLRQYVVTPVGRPPLGVSADEASATRARVRRLALTTLAGVRGADLATLRKALVDPDPQVRRLAVAGLSGLPANADIDLAIAGALKDEAAMVRYEALRASAARRDVKGCGPLLRALEDDSPHVALLAIDSLATGCPENEVADRLARFVSALVSAPDNPTASWHRGAHALVALARVAPERATADLDRLANHPVWQVRLYAARTAAILRADAVLTTLSGDPNHNVAEAAVAGFVQIAGHEADAIYRNALARSDYQITITAARALEGTPDRPAAAQALLGALARITEAGKDTSRDPRVAILERLREVGTSANAPALAGFLSDFDPRIADMAASILTGWTGQPQRARPEPFGRPPVPPIRELRRLLEAKARVTMASGGIFVLRVDAFDAPLSSGRFTWLSKRGDYDGLTFHRVVPNFVIQGGSPGANEFMGDAPYLRDEVGLAPHLRGSVGISTRGRDTGDAQIFIDLVDLPRLDHTYTVFAQVESGMEVVDAIMEGDVITRIDMLPD